MCFAFVLLFWIFITVFICQCLECYPFRCCDCCCSWLVVSCGNCNSAKNVKRGCDGTYRILVTSCWVCVGVALFNRQCGPRRTGCCCARSLLSKIKSTKKKKLKGSICLPERPTHPPLHLPVPFTTTSSAKVRPWTEHATRLAPAPQTENE